MSSLAPATLDAIYAEGVAVEDGNQFIEILSGKADIAGNRASIANAYAATKGFDLPPGDYLARVTLGATLSMCLSPSSPGRKHGQPPC